MTHEGQDKKKKKNTRESGTELWMCNCSQVCLTVIFFFLQPLGSFIILCETKKQISPNPKALSLTNFKPSRTLKKLFGSGRAHFPAVFPVARKVLSSPLQPFTSLSLRLSPYLSQRPPSSLPPSLSLCHSAHLGCLVELGTSVPVRGAQWGPVEDTKGGLPQLSFTLRPTQQPFGVYSSVLNPHTQPYHKGTSLAWAQRNPPHTPS